MIDMELTPIERRNNLWFKREDDFEINGVYGSKARVVYSVVKEAKKEGVNEFVTCGSRDSRQCEVVAKICDYLGVKSHLFMPDGSATDITDIISCVDSATIHRTKVGYNSVLVAHSSSYAHEKGFYYIPFGLEFETTIDINMHQVLNIPDEVKRIVVPCGGGMSMISIIKGLEHYNKYDKEVLGVIVGKDPLKNFKNYVNDNLFTSIRVKYTFVKSELKYHQTPALKEICGITLDTVYEAKCIPFLNDNDLMWIVGKK